MPHVDKLTFALETTEKESISRQQRRTSLAKTAASSGSAVLGVVQGDSDDVVRGVHVPREQCGCKKLRKKSHAPDEVNQW